MRIMTSNIWGDYFGNEVTVREDQLFEIYSKYSPDVIGFQEVTESWHNSTLFKNLSQDYMILFAERFPSNVCYVPMAVKKEYNILAKGFEYFDNMGDKSKSVSWAVIEGKKNKVAVCNTHFWWMHGTESEATRKGQEPLVGDLAYAPAEIHENKRSENAMQLSQLMKYLGNRFSCPVFAMGDMNAFISEKLFDVYKGQGISQLFDIAREKDTVSSHHGDPVRGKDGRYHGNLPTKDYNYSLDHIVGLGDGFTVEEYRIVREQAALDATDHSPVYVDIEIE